MQTCVKFSAPVKLRWVDGKLDKIHKIGSLQEMCAFTVTICLYRRLKLDLYYEFDCNNKRQIYCKDQFHRIYNFVEDMKDKIINSALKLLLPLKLQKRILYLRLPIGFEFVSWITAHINEAKIIGKSNFLPEKLIWTSNGTVDYKKTAEIFIKDDGIRIWKRFILACINCLENYIFELWPFVKYDVKATFIDGKCKDVVCREANYSCIFMLKYWIGCCEGSSQSNENKYYLSDQHLEFQLLVAAFCNNLTAVEYFLCKFKPDAVKEVIIKFCEVVLSFEYPEILEPSDVRHDSLDNNARGAFLDLISLLLNENEKLELFKKNPVNTLSCFRHWPQVGQFLEIANHLYSYLSTEHFIHICLEINGFKSLPEEKDTYYDFADIFLQFWLNAPKVLREKCDFNSLYPFSHIIVIFKDRSRSGKFIKQISEWFRQDPSSVTCTDLFFFKTILLIFTDPTSILQLEQNITYSIPRCYLDINSYQKACQKANKNFLEVLDKFPNNFLDLYETHLEIISELIDV